MIIYQHSFSAFEANYAFLPTVRSVAEIKSMFSTRATYLRASAMLYEGGSFKMKATKFQRIAALVLAFLCVFGGMTFAASAKEVDSEESTLANIKELLNAISYNEYVQLEEYAKAKPADKQVSIIGKDGVFFSDAGNEISAEGNKYEHTGDAQKDKDGNKDFDMQKPGIFVDKTAANKQGLYIPDTGKVEWSVSGITKPAKYNMYIEYYPFNNKSADVERIFLINGKVPFAEARYISMSKYWTTPYPDATLKITSKMDSNAILNEAKTAGFTTARIEPRIEGKKTVNYLVCEYPKVWTAANTAFVDKYDLRFFTADIDNNEIRESLSTTPEWSTYIFKDGNGFIQEPFSIVIGPDDDGNVTLTLEGVNEPVVISEIKLVPAAKYDTYEEYLTKNGYKTAPQGTGKVKIEAEYFSGVSDQTVYPLADTTSAVTSPVATNKTYLNTIGGEKWQNVGQWVEYDFSVSESGMYSFATRYKQNVLEGMSTSRVLYIYSGDGVKKGDKGYYNGIPFEEATRLKFNYNDNWQTSYLSDGTTNFEFYFEKDVQYTIRLEVSLGAMGGIVSRVQEVLDAINNDYLDILKVTGTSPDEFKDYNFYRTLPNTMGDMYEQYEEIAGTENPDSIIATILKDSTKSSMTATLENVATLLHDMSTDEDEVAKNLTQLKTYIGSLGTWLGDAKTQPLMLDYITVQNKSEKLPRANANFFASLWHEVTGFFQSFLRNYDRMGALTESENSEQENVEVWLAYGRDQSQVIRNLINNDFTKNTGVTVNLKLVAGGTLLPSILAGKGPDVYLGLGSGDVINYAIRGALAPVETMEGFEEAKSDFNRAAMMVLEIECAGSKTKDENGNHDNCHPTAIDYVPHCYGLPETQSFPMMFVREDILADLNIEIPKTWDDVKKTIPILQANNMEIAMSSDSNIFIYQMGGELFADDGMRINLDSNKSLVAFETMCEMFTMYSFPYQYDFANRFRTGEMPIGFADYTGTYNQLKVFATEIEGLWSFYPLPGIADEDGNINNESVSGVSAVVLISYDRNNAKAQEKANNAWKFMKWYVGADCQINYSNEMVAILGPSAKHATANREALESLPWTRQEYLRIDEQFNHLAAIPNYPGAYIIGRYTKFAFLDAYNDNYNPVESLLGYIDYINEEITRKRDEFGLETLDKEKKQTTLAVKRMQEAEEELIKAQSDPRYLSTYQEDVNAALGEIKNYTTEDYAELKAIAERLTKHNPELFGPAAEKLQAAADRLREYEEYK